MHYCSALCHMNSSKHTELKYTLYCSTFYICFMLIFIRPSSFISFFLWIVAYGAVLLYCTQNWFILYLVSVLSGQESRGVLRKISDMLEMIMKRMDAMSKLGNTTNTHRLDELSSALDRYSVPQTDTLLSLRGTIFFENNTECGNIKVHSNTFLSKFEIKFRNKE